MFVPLALSNFQNARRSGPDSYESGPLSSFGGGLSLAGHWARRTAFTPSGPTIAGVTSETHN